MSAAQFERWATAAQFEQFATAAQIERVAIAAAQIERLRRRLDFH